MPESVKKLIPYQSARRIGGNGRIWLNANELEAPLSFDSNEIANNSEKANYNRYPDFLPHDIATAYKNYCETDAETVAVRGADEAIDLLIRAFCQPGKDKILISSPTYAMYEFCADALAIETIDVPLKADFNLNVSEIIAQAKSTNIVFLCSPNNPTGNAIPRADLLEVLEGTKKSALVVVDEAYIEFELSSSVVDLIADYPNLVVIRTLSKAFGLAAVRCGFILSSVEIMSYVAKLIPPYPMPDCSAEIVLKALSEEGLKLMKAKTAELINTRNEFAQTLSQFDFIEEVYPSATNFVLLRVNENHDIFNVLLSDGIVTRNQHHEPALRHCVRISIGSEQSMKEVIMSLTQYSQSALQTA